MPESVPCVALGDRTIKPNRRTLPAEFFEKIKIFFAKPLDKCALNAYNTIIKKKGGYIFETS